MLAVSVAGCSAADGPLGTAQEAISVHQSLWVSSPNTSSAHTVSIAAADGTQVVGAGWIPDRVVGYEYGGLSWVSVYNSAANTWAASGSNNWPVPASTASDGHAFGSYEGAPTVVAFHESSNSSHNYAHALVYVGKSGSTQNGTKGVVVGPSTDVYAISSINSGASWAHPVLLTTPPAQGTGFVRWAIDYPVATAALSSSGAAFGRTWVLWRQRGVDAQGHFGTPQWMLGSVGLDPSTGALSVATPVSVPMQALAGPPMLTVRAAFQSQGVVIAFPTYDNGNDVCPGTGTTPMNWLSMTSDDLSTWSSLQISSDSTWKKCVAGSSFAAGNPYTRNVARPYLAIDPVTQTSFVTIAKGNPTQVQVFKMLFHGSSWTPFFTVTPPTSGSNRDEWSPALAINHPLGNSDFTIGLTWHDTRMDTTSSTGNQYENEFGVIFSSSMNMWQGLGSIEQPLQNLPPEIVDDYLGDYEGITADPDTLGSFLPAWGDQRAVGLTQVWAGQIVL